MRALNATAEETEQQEEGQEERSERTFVSTSNNLALVRVPTRRTADLSTGVAVKADGEKIRFKDSRYTTSDPGEIEFLEEHKNKGYLFHELEQAPPDPAGTIDEIIEAAVDGDADKIASLLVTERHSHSRPEVLAAARKALEKIDGDFPPVPSRPQHEVPRVRREPATGAHVPKVDEPGPPSGEFDNAAVGHVGLVSTDPSEDEVERQPRPEQTIPADPRGPSEEPPAEGDDPVVNPTEGNSQPETTSQGGGDPASSNG